MLGKLPDDPVLKVRCVKSHTNSLDDESKVLQWLSYLLQNAFLHFQAEPNVVLADSRPIPTKLEGWYRKRKWNPGRGCKAGPHT